jgi:hypothetical protein
MFVLARAYYSALKFDQAASMYDKIISIAPAEQKENAKENKRVVLENYGQ